MRGCNFSGSGATGELAMNEGNACINLGTTSG